MATDLFKSPDYYQLDDLFTEEHILVREATREWVKREVSPIIEDYAQRAEFPKHLVKGLAEVGAFGPYIPQEYGGAGLDQISYGLMMQEIERGDSGVRSTCSVQSSLVMYPIYKYGNEEQRQRYLIEACGDDAELRRRVDALLAAHEEPESYLDRPAIQLGSDSGTETDV